MAQQLSMTTDPRRTYRTVLGGQNVRVRVWWQAFDRAWYLTLSWLDGRVILAGARLVEDGRPLEGQVTDFTGSISVDGIGHPGRDAWSTTHRLLYVA